MPMVGTNQHANDMPKWVGMRGARVEEAEGQIHRTPSRGRGSWSAPTRTRTWNPLIKRVERSRHCELGRLLLQSLLNRVRTTVGTRLCRQFLFGRHFRLHRRTISTSPQLLRSQLFPRNIENMDVHSASPQQHLHPTYSTTVQAFPAYCPC
jgi:hypothetical protein